MDTNENQICMGLDLPQIKYNHVAYNFPHKYVLSAVDSHSLRSRTFQFVRLPSSS